MIHEVLEGVGGWDLRLRPDTPMSVTDELDLEEWAYSQVIITPVRVDPAVIGTDQLTEVSLYSGLLLRSEARTERLAGPGLWAAFGRSDGAGPQVGAGLTGTETLRTWIGNIDLDPFITRDSTLDNVASITWTSDRVMSYREAIESIFDVSGLPAIGGHLFIDPRRMTICCDLDLAPSWRQQRLIAAGVSWSRPLLSPDLQGREVGIGTPLLRCRFRPAHDLESWVSDVIITDAGGTATTNGSKTYSFPDGVDVDMTRYINDTSITSGTGSSVATAELEADNLVATELVAYTDDPDVLDIIAPGTLVEAWDPVSGIYDTTATGSITIRGRKTFGRRLAAQSVRAPIREGMGVYVRRYIGQEANDVIDLSPWFIPETGDATIELGEPALKPLRNVTRRAGARRQ